MTKYAHQNAGEDFENCCNLPLVDMQARTEGWKYRHAVARATGFVLCVVWFFKLFIILNLSTTIDFFTYSYCGRLPANVNLAFKAFTGKIEQDPSTFFPSPILNWAARTLMQERCTCCKSPSFPKSERQLRGAKSMHSIITALLRVVLHEACVFERYSSMGL